MDAEEGSELSEYVQSLTLRDRDKKIIIIKKVGVTVHLSINSVDHSVH